MPVKQVKPGKHVRRGPVLSVMLATLLVGSTAWTQAWAQTRPDLHRLKESLEAISQQLDAEGVSPRVRSELGRLRTQYDGHYRRLLSRLDDTERRLVRLGLTGVASERMARARAAFEASHGALLEGLDRLQSQPTQAELEACLTMLEPLARATREDILSAQELSLRAPKFRAPPLIKSGVTETAAIAADDKPEASLIGSVPDSIQELAESLDGPIAAYEFVKNNTRYELYFGAMKGSEQTFLEGRGNDADINAFLVDLLRAEGVPARFVRGVIQLPIDTAMNLFGVEQRERVEQALAAAAVPYEPVLAGGVLSGIEMEHIWAEAYVPYSNYRGAGLDDQGKRWIPLDASFKFHDIDEGIRVLEGMGFDAGAFVDESFVADPLEDPLEALGSQVSDYLDANLPGTGFEDALRRVDPQPEVYGLLPASLPYDIVSVNGVSFEAPFDLEHRIQFLARNRQGDVILDASFPASRLLGRRLTLSYVAATPEDRETSNAFGSIYLTPPYLIEVRPVIRSAGLVVASGNPIGMGLPFDLTVEFQAPAGSLDFENEMIAGAYAAIALSGRAPTFQEAAEARAGEILSQRALNYLKRWNEADDHLAGLTRVINLRPLPSHVMVKNHIEVDYATDESLIALTFEWKGVDVDADLRPSAPVAAEEDDDATRDFFLLSGLVGSDLESRVLEDDLGVTSISTLKLIRLANATGIEVKDIDASNVDDALAEITLEPALEDAIRTQVHLGRLVTAPATDVTLLAWTGGGFVARDPVSGESAYLLSGVIAGGSSAVPPEDFPPDTADALTDPEESQEDPSEKVAAIVKVSEGDFQEGIVAQELEFPLEVFVTDIDGNPVADGASITFRALEPGSVLASLDATEQGQLITVPTQGGFARARFVLGPSTRLRPRFVLGKPSDTFMTQVGLYSVTAESGDVALEEPLVAFAFPDAEEDADGRHARLRLVSGTSDAPRPPLTVSAVPLWAEAVDQFGNPISNIEVTYTVGDAERFSAGPLPAEFTNAQFQLGDGFADAVSGLTAAGGIFTFVKVGDVDATRYFANALLEDTKLGQSRVEFVRDTKDFGSGLVSFPVGERLEVFFAKRGVNLPNGEHLWMGEAGSQLPSNIFYTLRAFQEQWEVITNAQGKAELRGTGRFKERVVTEATVEPVLLDGSGNFEPGAITDSPDGTYQSKLFLGPEPGERRISSRVLAAKLTRPVVDPDTEEVSFVDFTRASPPQEPGFSVWGATVRLRAQEPDPIFVDANGHVEDEPKLTFEILPTEVDTMLRSFNPGRQLRVFQDGSLYVFSELPDGPVEISPNIFFDPSKVYQAEIALLPDTSFELSSERERLNLFNLFIDSAIPAPSPLLTVQEGRFATSGPTAFAYFIQPTEIDWTKAEILLFETDKQTEAETEVARLDGSSLEGAGLAVLDTGFEADILNKDYRAELVVERLAGQRRSTPFRDPFGKLLYNVVHQRNLEFQVDPINQQTCFLPGLLVYHLTEEADVLITVTIDEVEHVLFRGIQDPATVPFERFEFRFDQSGVFEPKPDTHKFRIAAVAVAEPELAEEVQGKLSVRVSSDNVLPVGQTFVKGVGLLDGHLVTSSTDVRIPGRGPALEVVRTYSSSGVSDEGVLGAGWNLNYFSTLVITDCFWTIRGGDGSGQRFTQVGDEFIPQKGYHTELRRNPDGSFDFFTKGRVRFHYVDIELFEGDPLFDGKPTLDFIEDPNGNRIQLSYDSERILEEAREVFADGSEGRVLTFDYENVRGVPRVRRITGPLGLEVTYEYDSFANLIKVTRDERVEEYEYSIGNVRDRHNLTAATDPNGNRTLYIHFEDDDVFPGESGEGLFVQDKFEWVKEVREPEGVTTSFVYDRTRVVTDQEFISRGTDARGNVTTYTLNGNGSPLEINEPGDIITKMEWAVDDITKLKETDANGRVTRFEYDTNANLIKEIIETAELGEVITEFNYDPIFNKMTRKVDAEGRETLFEIDPANGNLLTVTDAELNVTTFEYVPDTGDLELQQGPRDGMVTEFVYDPFGNPETVTDPLSNVTTNVYDERSRLRSSSDTFGRSMTQDFDELDRVETMRRTDGKGSSAEEVIKRTYHPGGQVRTETNGLNLTTEFFLDDLNRVERTEDALGFVTEMFYDGNGNLTGMTDRRGVRTINTYDDLNRLETVEVEGPFSPPQVVSEFAYDDVGNKRFETDVHGHETEFIYDELYRLRTRRLSTEHEETFTYDRVGNKLTESDANERVGVFEYDDLNRLKLLTDPEGNQVQFDYDESGNQTLEEDLTRGLKTEMEYDFLNRPTLRTVGSAIDDFSNVSVFEYEDPAHRVTATDPRGFQTTTGMDGFDRVHQVTRETGTEDLITTNFYDGTGNLRQTRDAEGRVTDFVYDGLNRLKRIEHPLSLVTEFDYDGEGNKTFEKDRRDVVMNFSYDNLGRLTGSEVVPSLTGVPSTTVITYDDVNVKRLERDARGFVTTFEMDGQERVTRIEDPDGNEQVFVYDGVNKREETDKRKFVTKFEYDGLNRLTKVTDALDRELNTVYEDADRQVIETDKRGIVNTTQLDALGRLVSVTRAGITLEQHEYDGNNNRTLSTDANGNQTQFGYDGANRLIDRTDGLGSLVETATSFTYDRVGNLFTEKDGRVTGSPFDIKNTYDELNRLRFVEDGENNITEFEYDGEGNRKAQIEPEGQRTEFDYGELNELMEVRMADTGVFRYDYDENRNRIRQVDAEDNGVEFRYDNLNRLERMIQDPSGFNLITDHDYDPNGNETKLTDPKGQVIDFEYDELNRMEAKIYSLTPEDFELFTRTHRIDFGYDPNDNLIRVDELRSSGTDPPTVFIHNKTYDDLDRLETETDTFGKTLTYDYDDQGNRTLLRDPDNKETVYTYDVLNRLETLTTEGGQTVYTYFPDGLKETVTNPNATVSTFDYDAADRLTSIDHEGPGGTVSAYTYEYTPNGNRLSQIETNAGRNETTTYTYDPVNRLETVNYPVDTTFRNGRLVTYTYDPVGNRKTETDTDPVTTATLKDLTYDYGAINRLETITDNLDTTQNVLYEYDANGNTLSKTKAGVETRFLYSIRDQLGEVQQGASILGRYGYDFDGRRILKIGADGRRHYTYDQLSVITEADEDGITVSKYDYGLDQLVSLDNRNEGRSFFHLDILGSTVSLTDGSGSARESIFYDAWGNERERIGSSTNKFTFTGLEKDDETGLIYARARFYDPDIGRFLTQDNLLGDVNRPPTLHRYSYVMQSPFRFVDPSGRLPICLSCERSSQEESAQLELLRQQAIAFGGAVVGFGKVLASPFVLTFKASFNLTGALAFKASGGLPIFRPEALAVEQALNTAAFALENPGEFAKEVALAPIRNIDEALERGDVFGAATGAGELGGQLFFAYKAIQNLPKINFNATPAPATVVNAGGAAALRLGGVPSVSVTITGPGSSLPAGILLSSAASNAGDTESQPHVRAEGRNGNTQPKAATQSQGAKNSGNTESARRGTTVHAQLAAERRASKEFDVVNQRLRDTEGNPIRVPKRVDLKSGEPKASKGTQTVQPDAVSFGRRLIIDDKPLGRNITKDRQEIIRFIKAFEAREGALPDTIAITRYDPKTRLPVRTDLFKPSDFLPKK